MLQLRTVRTRIAALAALGGAFLLPAPAAHAQGFIANQIENLISTENAQVEIEGLSLSLIHI